MNGYWIALICISGAAMVLIIVALGSIFGWG